MAEATMKITADRVPVEPSDVDVKTGTLVIEVPVKQDASPIIKSERMLIQEGVVGTFGFKVIRSGPDSQYPVGTIVVPMQPADTVMVSPKEVFFSIIDEGVIIATLNDTMENILAREAEVKEIKKSAKKSGIKEVVFPEPKPLNKN